MQPDTTPSSIEADALSREEGVAIAGGDQFGAGLAAAVWVVAAERFVFPVGPGPFLVIVALVASDDDDRL